MESFEKSPFYLELKLYILHHFLNDFEYNQIDRLLKVFEKNLVNTSPEYHYLVTNLNPIKTSVLIMDFLDRIVKSYAITEFRARAIRESVMENLKAVLVNLYNPKEIKR